MKRLTQLIKKEELIQRNVELLLIMKDNLKIIMKYLITSINKKKRIEKLISILFYYLFLVTEVLIASYKAIPVNLNSMNPRSTVSSFLIVNLYVISLCILVSNTF